MDKWLSRTGTVVSIIYITFLFLLLQTRWAEFLVLDLNEQGDFLAGVFGPLAFLWLVLGFFQQRIELKQNTEALELQASELNNSVKQQEALVQVTREQFHAELEALQHERKLTRSASQPLFTVIKVTKNSSSSLNYILRMRNIGSSATNIDISYNSDQVAIKAQYLSDWEKESEINFLVLYKNQRNVNDIRLTISYTDLLGYSGYFEYDLILTPVPYDLPKLEVKKVRPEV